MILSMRGIWSPCGMPQMRKTAHVMADMICGAYADRFCDDITKEEADRVWEQCLTDSRRMICEPEYEDIFRT